VIESIAAELSAHDFEDSWARSFACHHVWHVLHNAAGLALAEEFYLTTLKSLAIAERQLVCPAESA
jgi:hypothetical protein